MNKLAISLMITCVLIGTLLHSVDARAFWQCTPCKTAAECNQEPIDYCLWGEVRDNCGRRSCAKGPGDRCGGPINIYGKCADGLMCKPDDKCHGCAERDGRFPDCFPEI